MFILNLHALLDIVVHVDSLVADCLVLIQMLDQGRDELLRDKELEVGLLVDVSIDGAPANDRVF